MGKELHCINVCQFSFVIVLLSISVAYGRNKVDISPAIPPMFSVFSTQVSGSFM